MKTLINLNELHEGYEYVIFFFPLPQTVANMGHILLWGHGILCTLHCVPFDGLKAIKLAAGRWRLIVMNSCGNALGLEKRWTMWNLYKAAETVGVITVGYSQSLLSHAFWKQQNGCWIIYFRGWLYRNLLWCFLTLNHSAQIQWMEVYTLIQTRVKRSSYSIMLHVHVVGFAISLHVSQIFSGQKDRIME